LLLQAGYLELVKASSDGMYAVDSGAGFSIETVRRLRRHKFPFAGALKTVPIDGLKLSPTDPKYVKLAQTRADHLERRFDAIKNQIAELLPQYVTAVESQPETPPALLTESRVAFYRGNE